MEDRVKPSGYKLASLPGWIIELPWDSAVPMDDPDYQDWLAAGNSPEPADPPEPVPPDWEGLYRDLIDPEKLFPLFLKIKSVAKTDLGVNASFTTLIPTLTSTRIEAALAAAIQELALDLLESGNRLSSEEKALWNAATEARGFSEAVKL